MLGNIGPLEIGIVLAVVLLAFGAKRLPELGSGLGRGMREFKEGVTGETRDEDDVAVPLNPPSSDRRSPIAPDR